MARKVIVVSTKDNDRKEIMTDATTWSELKAQIEASGLSVGDMKATVRDTKATLEHNQAVLPTGEFTLFLTPGKVKSGIKA